MPGCQGGRDGETVVLCRACHRAHHRESGDFARWKREGIQALFQDFGPQEARELLRRWGRRGGKAVYERHGREHMARIGRRGGRSTAARHGRGYMAELGRRGGRAAARRNGREALEVSA